MKAIPGRYALIASAVVAFLSGCGGGQPPMAEANGVQRSSVASTAGFTLIYAFNKRPDGTRPGGLRALDGVLYGTTGTGGSSNDGTVYRINATGAEKVLHNFHGGSADGEGPIGLLAVEKNFYGATASGGDSGPCSCGTVFKVTPSGSETLLHHFNGGEDGAHPSGNLFNWKGTLYGATLSGGDGCGSVGCGTVYGISLDGSERVLYRFKSGSDGDSPVGRLVAEPGVLYGATTLGGGNGCYYHNGCGTIFSVTLQGTEKILYRFKGGSDGAYPSGDLIAVNGTLYGTTMIGGHQNQGTVFSLSTSGVEKVLYRFHGPDGSQPQTGLLNVNGTLYGTTWQGGAYQKGTIFNISTAGDEKVLYSFGATDSEGYYPNSTLIAANGALFGTTYYGGKGWGAVFSFTP